MKRRLKGHVTARSFQYLKYPPFFVKKKREQLFTQGKSDRIRGNGFKLKGERFRLNIRKIFVNCGGSDALKQLAQRSWGCHTPGSVLGWIACGLEKPDPVNGIPAHDRGVELEDL